MTRKEAFEKIRVILGLENTMATAKLSDGSIIQWEGELKEGIALNIVDTEGNQTPMADGEHTMEDGTKITCVGGLITKIEAPVEESSDEMSDFEKLIVKHIEDFAAFTAKFEALESKVNEYEVKFAEITEASKAANVTVEDKFAKIVELVETISKEPEVIVPAPLNTFRRNRVEGEKTKEELWIEFQKQSKNI